MEATTKLETTIVNAENLHVLDNQQPSSCDESLEKVQRLVDLSQDNKEDLIYCQICGVARKKLYHHLRSAHNLTQAEYKIQFPESRLYNNSEMEYRMKSFISKGHNLDDKTRLVRNEKIRQAMLEGLKSIPQEEINEYMQKLHDGRDAYWQSMTPEERKQEAFRMMGNPCLYREYEYKGVIYRLRSYLEFVLVQSLVDANIEFEYEKKYVKLDHKGHVPDFFIEKLNLFVEAKGKYWYERYKEYWDSLGAQFVSRGYKYLFIVNLREKLDFNLLLDKLATSDSAVVYYK